MKVSGFWSLGGAVVLALMLADVLTHSTGTKTAFDGITTLATNTGNQIIGVKAS